MKKLNQFVNEALALNNIVDFSFLNTIEGVKNLEKTITKYSKEEDCVIEDIEVGYCRKIASFKKPVKVNNISVNPGIWINHKTSAKYDLLLFISSKMRKDKGITDTYSHHISTPEGYKKLGDEMDKYDISINDLEWTEYGKDVLGMLKLMSISDRRAAHNRMLHNKYVKAALKKIGISIDNIISTEHYYSRATYGGGSVKHDVDICLIILYALGKMLEDKLINKVSLENIQLIPGFNENVFQISGENSKFYINYKPGDIIHFGEDQRQLTIDIYDSKENKIKTISSKKSGNVSFGDISADIENIEKYANDIINTIS